MLVKPPIYGYTMKVGIRTTNCRVQLLLALDFSMFCNPRHFLTCYLIKISWSLTLCVPFHDPRLITLTFDVVKRDTTALQRISGKCHARKACTKTLCGAYWCDQSATTRGMRWKAEFLRKQKLHMHWSFFNHRPSRHCQAAFERNIRAGG